MTNSENKYSFVDGIFQISFSTRDDGNLSYNYGPKDEVEQNRAKFYEKALIDRNNLHLIQPTHSNALSVKDTHNGKIATYRQPLIAEGEFQGFKTGVDGYLTFDREEYVGLLSGDCIPLVTWHHESNMHGILHVGLLGVINKIVYNLRQVFEKYEIEPSDVQYLMGPAIHQESYNLRNSGLWSGIQEAVLKAYPEFKNFIHIDNNTYNLNLSEAVSVQLRSIGVDEEKIHRHPANTADPKFNFFSHYYSRETQQPDGRFMTVIGPNN